MPPQDLLLMVFCLVDDELRALGPPRSRGPAPTLADSEVVTIEVVGELWGIADDEALLAHFRRYHAAEFPALARVHRTTFARQAANLCWLKCRARRALAERLEGATRSGWSTAPRCRPAGSRGPATAAGSPGRPAGATTRWR